MRIGQSQVALASRRVASTIDTTRSSMQAWIGDRPAQTGTAGRSVEQAQAATRAAIARISTQTLAAANFLSVPSVLELVVGLGAAGQVRRQRVSSSRSRHLTTPGETSL